MKSSDKYNEATIFHVDNSKESVCSDIVKATKNCIVSGDNIQIKITPSFFDPFAARGTINLKLASVDYDRKTTVTCQTVPTKPTNLRLYLIIALLTIWTIAALVISVTIYSILTIIVGWAAIISIIHLTQVLNKKKLDNYISYIFSTIKSSRQKSGA